MGFALHDYQQVATDYILEKRNCGLFLDMGLGKTLSTLTAIQELRDEYFDVGKTLVVAPPRVAKDTWPNEIKKWGHIHLTYVMLTGTPAQRRANLKEEADIYITTRDMLRWLVDELGRDWDFDTVVVDELSGFKSASSKRFKALKKVRPLIRQLIGLTGTPKPKGAMNLWSQLYLIDGGKRLGSTITGFRRKYFDLVTWQGFPDYRIKYGADEQILDKIRDVCISMKAEDHLPLEKPMIIDHMIQLSDKERSLYRKLELDSYLEIADDEITALNAAALNSKLLQLSNGAIYTENKDYIIIHNTKIERLKEMLEWGENLLVYYQFKSDKERILQAIPEAVAFNDSEQYEQWNAGKIPLLLAHAASAGHGLNMQDGGHIIVWFGLGYDLELYEQANARLQRQGQKHIVRIYHLLCEGTRDEHARKNLEAKGLSQAEFMESLKYKMKLIREDMK